MSKVFMTLEVEVKVSKEEVKKCVRKNGLVGDDEFVLMEIAVEKVQKALKKARDVEVTDYDLNGN